MNAPRGGGGGRRNVRVPAPPAPPGLPAPRQHLIAGKYKVGRQIGQGAFGYVLEAENVAIGRIVAIKILSKASADSARRMRREARVLAGLHHTNICDVYDVGSLPDGRPFIVLERLRGETLDARLQRERRFSLERTVQIFSQILSALQAAHSTGIIHRDLKPANVFLVEAAGCPPIVKLVDFGLAKDLHESGSATRPGVACGSPPHMSPEQLRGDPVDERSDLFALGVMLYQVLAGRHPFFASTVFELASKILHEPAPALRRVRPTLPAWVEVVVRRALEKRPDNRFSCAAEMQRALLASESWRDCGSDVTETITHVSLPRLSNSSTGTPIY